MPAAAAVCSSRVAASRPCSGGQQVYIINAALRQLRASSSSSSLCLQLPALQQRRQQRRLCGRTMAAPQAAVAAAEAAGVKLQPSPQLVELLLKADAFTFDVDSTFCSDESIDEIAAFLGVGEQVAALTAQAMGGTVLFQDALAARLGVMNPSRDDMQRFLDAHPPKISPGIPELVQLLRQQGKQVFLVSGGFRIVIHPIAEMLGIPISHVFANSILFNEDGSYAGFDPQEFPSRSGGKREAVQHIKKTHGFQTVVMVGDGITDYEARAHGGADAFIGYGGVVYRENVAQLSDWYTFSIADISAALQQKH